MRVIPSVLLHVFLKATLVFVRVQVCFLYVPLCVCVKGSGCLIGGQDRRGGIAV